MRGHARQRHELFPQIEECVPRLVQPINNGVENPHGVIFVPQPLKGLTVREAKVCLMIHRHTDPFPGSRAERNGKPS